MTLVVYCESAGLLLVTGGFNHAYTIYLLCSFKRYFQNCSDHLKDLHHQILLSLLFFATILRQGQWFFFTFI
jgi:hypothetical protein